MVNGGRDSRSSKWIWSVVVILLLPVMYAVSLVPIAYGLRSPHLRLIWDGHVRGIYLFPLDLAREHSPTPVQEGIRSYVQFLENLVTEPATP